MPASMPPEPSRIEPARILVVDDEPHSARAIERMARHFGHEVVVAESVESAIRRFGETAFDVVLADVNLGRRNGFDLLSHVRARAPEVPVVLITGYASVDAAMEAIGAGAYDYIAKPPALHDLGAILRRAVEKRRAVPAGAAEPRPGVTFENIVGRSPQMLEIFKTVARVAAGKTSVLILGESGTGKELVARALHRHSPRSDKRFVPVNVSAIPEGLLESELFGHVRGAFTGASANRHGLFEEAHLGTLFLDEIGDLSLPLQAKLLRAIQEQRIKPVGGNEELTVDVRLVVATHQDLERMVRAGTFREDLYYRLNVVTIALPPLRERPQDIPILIEHFLRKSSQESGRPAPRFSPGAEQHLMAYSWPGNIRELANVVERAVVLSSQDVIPPEALPERLVRQAGPAAETAAPAGEFLTLEENSDRHVRRVLEATGGNRSQAARILGISRRTLHRMESRWRGESVGEEPEDQEPGGERDNSSQPG